MQNAYREIVRLEVLPANKIQRIPKGAGKKVPREKCRKVSKNFLTLFDDS